MISVIFSFLPIILIVFWMAFTTKRKSLNWEIKKGYICYNCKSGIKHTEDEIFTKVFDETDSSKLCVTCNRDRKINSINNRFINLFYRFQKWIVSKKSEKLFIWFIIPIFSFMILDITVKFTYRNLGLNWIYTTLNIIYLIISIYKTYYTSIKK